MHIKYCRRCHFAALAKKRLCQTCGSRNFVYEELSITSAAQDAQSMAHTVAGKVSHVVKDLTHELTQSAEKSLRASHQVIKSIKSKANSSQHTPK